MFCSFDAFVIYIIPGKYNLDSVKRDITSVGWLSSYVISIKIFFFIPLVDKLGSNNYGMLKLHLFLFIACNSVLF